MFRISWILRAETFRDMGVRILDDSWLKAEALPEFGKMTNIGLNLVVCYSEWLYWSGRSREAEVFWSRYKGEVLNPQGFKDRFFKEAWLSSWELKRIQGSAEDGLRRLYERLRQDPDQNEALFDMALYTMAFGKEAQAEGMFRDLMTIRVTHKAVFARSALCLAAGAMRRGEEARAGELLQRVQHEASEERRKTELARLLSGGARLDEILLSPQAPLGTGGVKYTQDAWLAVGAKFMAGADKVQAREFLEMARDCSLPWEPLHTIAGRWQKELNARK